MSITLPEMVVSVAGVFRAGCHLAESLASAGRAAVRDPAADPEFIDLSIADS